MNRGCFRFETDGINCENALPQLMLRYVVNQGCIGGHTDQIDCETPLPVRVSSESRLIQT